MSKQKRKTQSNIQNDRAFLIIYNRFKNIALNRFEWSNLPTELNTRYIENALFEHGRALFFQDNEINIALPCNPSNNVNIYGEHTSFTAFGMNYTQTRDLENSVLIRNNSLSLCTKDYIVQFAQRMTDIERTLDVNVKAQKTPFFIKTGDSNILSMKNIFSRIDSNEPAIYVDKSLNIDDIQVFPTLSPYLCDKLADYKKLVENECLSFLGINNSNIDKKERLITDEVNANNEFIDCNIDFMLESRKQACEEINAMFGLNISVEIKGGEKDGAIYSDDKTDNGEQR